jgi:hypothetical protein
MITSWQVLNMKGAKEMPLQFIRDEKLREDDAVRAREILQDMDWFNAHAAEIGDQYRGKYVAVADGKLFAADSRKEAYDLALAQSPTRQPFVIYIPADKRKMVYERLIPPFWGVTFSTISPPSLTAGGTWSCSSLNRMITRW